jgi:hypothetical protein
VIEIRGFLDLGQFPLISKFDLCVYGEICGQSFFLGKLNRGFSGNDMIQAVNDMG